MATALPAPHWLPAPENPSLPQNELHVWRASIDLLPAPLLNIGRILAPAERLRASRFVKSRDRDRFIAARGTLRKLLGRYLKRPPESLEFDYGWRGKPILRLQASDPRVRFNLSHSHGLALYVFSLDRDVGADMELIRTDYPFMMAAERVFTPRELNQLRALPEEYRAESFFIFWTRKEAYVKAHGDGLKIPLDRLEVSDLANELPGKAHGTEVVPWLPDPDGALSPLGERVASVTRRVRGSWILHSFQPAPGFVGCLATDGIGCQLRWLNYKG
jgi:4'-phosphopantetheinyl transferase